MVLIEETLELLDIADSSGAGVRKPELLLLDSMVLYGEVLSWLEGTSRMTFTCGGSTFGDGGMGVVSSFGEEEVMKHGGPMHPTSEHNGYFVKWLIISEQLSNFFCDPLISYSC
jgi:hypothetical protein